MTYRFDIFGAQIDGARDYQEDAFLVTHLGDKDNGGASLVVVADGMGGHAAGNVASNMAVQAFNRKVSSSYPTENLPEVLSESVISANNSIRETVSETAALKGMGCTLVCAVVAAKALRWVSVGDSHLYLIRDGAIKKKNADHSYGGFLDRLAAEGKEVEPEPGFSRNMLMSALTGDDIADIDCPETPLELLAGDRIILCSDGLDTLDHDQLLDVCASSEEPRTAVEALLKAVEDADMPRQDNTTVVVIDVDEQAEEAAPLGLAEEPAAAPAVPSLDTEDITEDPTRRQQRESIELPPVEETPAPAAGGGKGKLVVIALVLLAVLGAGGWFLLGGGQKAPVDIADLTEETDPADLVEDEAPTDAEGGEPETGIADTADEAPADAPGPETAEPAAAPGDSYRDALAVGGSGPLMVPLRSGSFEMGSRRMSAAPDEKPARSVRVRAFDISRSEVTVADYARFARATGRSAPQSDGTDPETLPVALVSWDDALYYTRWLSEQTGKRYRLPSEAEWEYAARSGTTTQFWWGRKAGRGKAHCTGCDSGLDPRKPAAVGSFDANPWALVDTAGNVAEWVHDCYHDSYDGAPSDGGVWEGGDCSVRIVRGGSFSSVPNSLRSAKRDKFRSDSRLDSIGFRVVRERD